MAERIDKKEQKVKTKSTEMARVEDPKVGFLTRSYGKAVKWLMRPESEEETSISSDTRAEIELMRSQCIGLIKTAYDNAAFDIYNEDHDSKVFNFERLGDSRVLDMQHEVYENLDRFVRVTFNKDVEFYRAYRKYLEELSLREGSTKTFKENVEISYVIGGFENDPAAAKALLLTLFNGRDDVVRWIYNTSNLMRMSRDLRRTIILSLVNSEDAIGQLFLNCLISLPKNFINSEQRAELLMDFASRHVGQDGPHVAKDSQEYILMKENTMSPYR